MGRPDPQLKQAMLSYLRQHYAGMCRHWFEDIEPCDLSNGTVKLLVHEPIQLRYLQRNCVVPFSEAAQEATGRLLAVQFVGEHDLPAHDDDEKSVEVVIGAGLPDSLSQLDAHEDMALSPDYTFDNFVVGPDNRLAHAAAYAVGQKPGRAYNPLFIHGGVGLGKTHLLQAICQAALRQQPHLKIYYTSCNGFMTQFLTAVKAGEMTDFRHKFRGVDLLLIDDVHDLSKRNRTQEEFFHTFNSLYQAGKQIVLSSDAPPSEIPLLEERLISRFNCGLVAEVGRPDFETRVAIIQSKAQMRGMTLPDDCASYIASKVDSNIRDLEGMINQLQGLLMVVGGEPVITMDLAREAVGEQERTNGSARPSVQEIIDAVSGYYGVKLTDLLSKRRHKSIALPRQIGMWLARKHTRHSLEEIGGYFGGRDHTTVMHAIKSINTKCRTDKGIEHDVNQLDGQFQNRPGRSMEHSVGSMS